MFLSIIVPFYQVEAYIGECLERLTALPADECEILLIDDCGRDSSACIAEYFAENHRNARVIRREKNGGLSAARNTGLDEAKGEYVFFLDSDDLPEAEAVYALAKRARAEELDVIKGRFEFFDDETGKRTPGPAIRPMDKTIGSAIFAEECRAGTYEPMVWQCIYRREFLKEIGLRMAEGLLFEDELFQAPALLTAKTAATDERSVIQYRQRAGSIMGSFQKSARWCKSYLAVCQKLTTLCDTLENGEPKQALRRRIGQIALSTAKNIAAYGLPEEIAREAKVFVRENCRELSGYALASGDAFVIAQGMLMRLSLTAFLALYARA